MPRSGFTLIELVMVLSLLVVLSSLTVSGIVGWQRRFPMEGAVSITQQQIQETRLAAIRTGESWVLTMPFQSTPGHRNSVHGGRSTGDPFQLPEGIQCQNVSGTKSAPENVQVIFQADGTSSDQVLILIEPNGNRAMMRMDRLTGNASVVPVVTGS